MKALVTIIVRGNWTDVRYAGDVTVVWVDDEPVCDRVYESQMAVPMRALKHYVGPQKYWGNADRFGKPDPRVRKRIADARNPRSSYCIDPTDSEV